MEWIEKHPHLRLVRITTEKYRVIEVGELLYFVTWQYYSQETGHGSAILLNRHGAQRFVHSENFRFQD